MEDSYLFWSISFFFFFKGTDETMLDKLRANHGQSPYFLTMKSQAAKMFGIVHFAGSVYYDVRGEHSIQI